MAKSSARSETLAQDTVDAALLLMDEVREPSRWVREIAQEAIQRFEDTKGTDMNFRIECAIKATRRHYEKGGCVGNGRRPNAWQLTVGINRARDVLHGGRRIAFGKLDYEEVLCDIQRRQAQRRKAHHESRAERSARKRTSLRKQYRVPM